MGWSQSVVAGRPRLRLNDATSRLLLDLTAGVAVDPDRRITDDELVLASRHGLLGVMATSDHPQVAEAARAPFARLAARQLVMERVLSRLLQKLAVAQIPATVVKGPALARWAYMDPRQRTFTDLDLVVPANQIAEAIDVLRRDEATLDVPPKTPRADKRNIPMRDPSSGVSFTLDLHWDLFSYTQLRGCAAGAVGEGWTQAEWIPDHELGPIWRFPEEVLISFLAAHAVLDHRFRLILFRDLAELSTGVDWDRMVDFSRRHFVCSTSYAAWHMTAITTAAPVPASTLAALRPRSLIVSAMEFLLTRTDLVHFDGHRPHLLNLAMVLLHDRPARRIQLMLTAPVAFPQWLKRVEGENRVAPSPALQRRRVSIRGARVLHVLPVDVARGAQTYAKSMRDSLDSPETAHRTAIIFRSEAQALDADVDLAAARGLGRRVGFSPTALFRLRSYLRSWEPDVVVAHGGEALKYAAFARKKGTKLVYYKIGTAQDLLQSPARRAFHRMLVQRADLVAGVSREMVIEAQELFGAKPDRTITIPNGRDPAMFSQVAPARGATSVRFLYVSHLTRTKRPERFIDVISSLRASGVDAIGALVGDGPLLEGLRQRTHAGIEFLGRRDDVPALLANHDVFLFTSLVEGEGMPGVLIEAGFSGLPTVTTDVPGARAIVEDGVTGYVVAVDDFGAFVDAAKRLALDPGLRSTMGAAARLRCLGRFTLESSVELWRRQLSNLLATTRR